MGPHISLDDGARYSNVKFTALDASSGAQKLITVSLVLDRQIPEVNAELATESIITGTSTTSTNSPSVTITGTTSGNAEVSITQGQTTEKVTANSSGTWTYTFPTTFTSGTYDYTVVIKNPSGQSSQPLNQSFTVDLSQPNIDYQIDLDNDTNIKGDYVTSNTTQELTGRIGTNETLTITMNGAAQTPTIAADGNWTLTLTNLTAGDYAFDISVKNDVGTVSSATPKNCDSNQHCRPDSHIR